MPSAAELCPAQKLTVSPVNNKNNNDSNINLKMRSDVEGLVLELKENLRLSGPSMKALPCSHLSRKSSRASPYRIPGKYLCDSYDTNICGRKKNKTQEDLSKQEDPYELLQTLLRSGNLVNEAVRRVKLGLQQKCTKTKFYESDEEFCESPMLRMC